MKNTVILLFAVLLTGCQTTYQISTLNYDPIYGPDNTELKLEVINSDYALNRKFRTDDRFRWNYAKFAMDQPLSWYYSFYSQNNLFRYNSSYTPWDLYVNKYDFWFSWNNNIHFGIYSPYRYSRYRFDPFWNDWYFPYYSNFHIWNRPSMAHMNRYRQSIQIDIESRERNNRVRSRSIVTNNNVRIYTRPELNEDKLRESVNLLKGRNSNIIVREYNNLDKYNNKNIIINNNNKTIRNYGRPEISNNNIIKNSPPPRNYSPPPTRSNIIGRSSNVKININRKD